MMAEIKLSYSAHPMGLIGTSPQPIKRNEPCQFSCQDPGTFEVEFVNGSPSDDNVTKFNKDTGFVAHKPGRFKFQCTFFTPDGTKIVVGAPDDPRPGS